jgi:hypothetical protein
MFLHNAIHKVCSVHSKLIGRSILASYIDTTKIRHIKKKKLNLENMFKKEIQALKKYY